MPYFLGRMATVWIAHVSVAVLLYYGRVKNLSATFDSDFLVFVAPALLAFSGYFSITWASEFLTCRLPVKVGFVTLIAITATAFSCVCAATVAFNRFGT